MSRAAYQKNFDFSYTGSRYCGGKTARIGRPVVRRLRRALLMLLMVAAFFSGFFSRSLLSAHAEEECGPVSEPYYTGIQLKQGDSLWNIAHSYAGGSGLSVREYVDELRRINHLESDQIHAGEFLTVVCYDR